LLAAGCVALLPASASHGTCVAHVVYDGVDYTGMRAKVPVHAAARVGTATLPACHDLIINGKPAPGEHDQPVAAYRAGDSQPQLALKLRGDEDLVYIAAGFLLVSPAHPLHGAFYGSRREPDATSRRSCGKRRLQVVGRVRYPVLFGEVDLNHDRRVTIDALTKLRGRTLFGVPYVRRGDHVVATAIRCGSTLVARSFRWAQR
jgi:hypothetical protein